MNQLIFIESKTARQEQICKTSILDMMKPPVPMLTKDGRSTIKLVTGWYEVNEATIKSILQRNEEEFSVDGIEVIRGKAIKALEIIECQDASNPRGQMQDASNLKYSPSITLLPKQAILRIGMLLTESQRATQVRDLLIAGEKQLSYRKKTKAMREAEKWQAQREGGKIVRRMTMDAIKANIPPTDNWAFKNYTNLTYKSVFGKNAKQLKVERGAKDNDVLRDGFTEAELELTQRAEFMVAGLVVAGLGYHDVKNRIQELDLKKV